MKNIVRIKKYIKNYVIKINNNFLSKISFTFSIELFIVLL